MARKYAWSRMLVVPGLFVTEYSAGYVTKTSLVPDEKLTAEPPLEDESTVVRASVVPDDVYVPIPTSHSEVP